MLEHDHLLNLNSWSELFLKIYIFKKFKFINLKHNSQEIK